MNKQLAIIFLSLLVLMIWKTSYSLTCFSLIIPAMIVGILFFNSFQLQSEKKKCFANCYFNQNSIWYKLFTKRFLVFIISIILSLILTLSLSLAIIRADVIDIVVFLVDTILILYLYNRLKKNNSFNEKIKYPILKHTVSWINGALISILYIFITLNETPPSYLSNDLTKTIQQASIEVASNCKIIDYPSRLSAELSAEKWWLMINATIKLKNQQNQKEEWLVKLLWVLFLVGNYLAFYAFSRYVTELLYQFDDKLKEKKE
jgi:hypothetical protein